MARRENDEIEGVALVQERNQWLWSLPTAMPGDEDADDEIEVGMQTAEFPEEEGQARHLYSRRTHSRAAPPGVSPSGRLFQTVQHSRMEYSRPTMSIRSQWSTYSSSARPLPRQQAPCLMNWTPIARQHLLPQQSTSSLSQKVGRKLIRQE